MAFCPEHPKWDQNPKFTPPKRDNEHPNPIHMPSPPRAADCTIIMSRTLKVTDNHVMYDRGVWFLRVIMSSSRALCCLPSVKKQKHEFQVCFVDRARHRKIVEDKDWENLKKERVGTNFENILCRSEKEKICSMYNKTIISFGFCDIQNNQGRVGVGSRRPMAEVDFTKTSSNNSYNK